MFVAGIRGPSARGEGDDFVSSDRLVSPYALDAEGGADRASVEDVRGETIFFDGVFKGDYSLAIVNRYLARALIGAGVDLVCHTSEPDWQTDRLLNAMPRVRRRMRENYPDKGSFDVHLRNTWPPATHDMVGKFNAYVCFAWEESELPPHLVDAFNRDLDLVMVTSNFVKEAFRHSGVTIPVEVVGDGCDHVTDFESQSAPVASPRKRARILHVSSGFPRKGPDLLVQAFIDTFRLSDDVELLIKTFPNRDNVIPSIMQGLGERDSEAVPITVIDGSCTYQELIGLYQTATMVVAPSRGEGFGLPLAEAMMLGIPVVTTNYSGQLDFCRPDTAWLVDYTLSPSRAHVAGPFSMWADAKIDELGAQMRAVLEQPELARARSARAKELLGAHFSWRSVSARVLRALAIAGRSSAAATVSPPWSMDLVSSWQQRCGIATYAGHLFSTPALAPHVSSVLARRFLDDELPAKSGTEAIAGGPPVSRLWGHDIAALMQLARRLEHGRADVLWLQHHPGHFSTPDMEILARALQSASYRVRALTLHSVKEALRGGSLQWTTAFDVAFVHAAEDAAALSAAGHKNPVVIPHGFIPPVANGGPPDSAHFTIGSFGFLTPHKNIDRLLLAFFHARRFCPRLRLKILNCGRPSDDSRLARAVVENLIDALDGDGSVSARFDFIPEDELVAELATCDLLAFPYGPSTEAATGAARIAMSVDRPLLCSRSTVLRDLWPVSHVLRSEDIDCIAEALVSLAQSEDLLRLCDHDRRKTIGWYSYPRVAGRYAHHIERLLDEGHELRQAA
jgi:glycosyltransferase involved in cell wall biosynthesis